MKVIFIDSVKLKRMLDRYNEVTLVATEIRVDVDTGKVTLVKKRDKPMKK